MRALMCASGQSARRQTLACQKHLQSPAGTLPSLLVDCFVPDAFVGPPVAFRMLLAVAGMTQCLEFCARLLECSWSVRFLRSRNVGVGTTSPEPAAGGPSG